MPYFYEVQFIARAVLYAHAAMRSSLAD